MWLFSAQHGALAQVWAVSVSQPLPGGKPSSLEEKMQRDSLRHAEGHGRVAVSDADGAWWGEAGSRMITPYLQENRNRHPARLLHPLDRSGKPFWKEKRISLLVYLWIQPVFTPVELTPAWNERSRHSEGVRVRSGPCLNLPARLGSAARPNQGCETWPACYSWLGKAANRALKLVWALTRA